MVERVYVIRSGAKNINLESECKSKNTEEYMGEEKKME